MPYRRGTHDLNAVPGNSGSPLLIGLVEAFKMDEFMGTYTGAARGIIETPAGISGGINTTLGKRGWCPLFVASRQQSTTTPHVPALAFVNGDFTIACWVRATTLINAGAIWSKAANGGGGSPETSLFWITGVGFRFRVNRSVSKDANSGNTITTATWYSVICWQDGTAQTINIQVDANTPVSTALAGTTFTATNQPFQIGRSGNFWDGEIDNLCIWNRALKSDERTLWRTGGVGGLPNVYPFNGTDKIMVTVPSSYQVFQRNSSGFQTGTGTITIQGTYDGTPTAIEASWNGGSFTTIDAAPVNGKFSGSLTGQTNGQGTLIVRFTNLPSITQSIPLVGIGDVILCAGQSNMSGRGTNSQVYSHATLKAGLLGNDYKIKELVDPYDSNIGQIDTVSNDGTLSRGSYIPLLATEIMRDEGVPVMFIASSMGGTTSAQWQPNADHPLRSTLYGSSSARGLLAGGLKCILWHQGETDAENSVTQVTYNANLDTIANTFASDLGVPIVACKLQNSSIIPDAQEDVIRAAIVEAWGDNVNVLQGPDFSDLTSDDSYHFLTDAHLLTAAQRWWVALQATTLY